MNRDAAQGRRVPRRHRPPKDRHPSPPIREHRLTCNANTRHRWLHVTPRDAELVCPFCGGPASPADPEGTL